MTQGCWRRCRSRGWMGREAIENTRPRPISPYYSDMSLEMARQFNAALKGEVPVPQALEELEGELQNIAN